MPGRALRRPPVTGMPDRTQTGGGKIRTYSPKLISERACGFDGDLSHAPKMEAARGPDGLIPVSLDEQVIMQRISHGLYSDPRSGLRELYANEVRACKISRDRHGASPRIDITIDAHTRELAIHGSDSLGISQDVFLQVMTVLGKSDNFDGRTPGQFGMGFAAYTCLSDIVIVETHSRLTGERYGFMGKSGVGFDPIPWASPPEECGTRVRLTVRKDVNLGDLVQYACEGFWNSGIETHLHLPQPITDGDGCTEFPAGEFRIGPCRPPAYMSRILCDRHLIAFPDGVDLSRADGSPADRGGLTDGTISDGLMRGQAEEGRDVLRGHRLEAVEFGAADGDVEVSCVIAARSGVWSKGGLEYRGHVRTDGSHVRVFLAGMPISADIGSDFLNRISAVTVNVLDERKYAPTPDRERFTEESLDRLRGRVEDLVRSSLPQIRPRNLYDLNRFGWTWNVTGRPEPEEYVERACHAFWDASFRIRRNASSDQSTVRSDSVTPHVPGCEGKMVYLPRQTGWKIDAVRSIIPDASVFSIDGAGKVYADMLRELGIVFGDEMIAEHGIGSRYRNGAARKILLYGCAPHDHTGSIVSFRRMSDSLPDEPILAVPRDRWTFVRAALSDTVQREFYITRKTKRQTAGIIDYDDLMSEVGAAAHGTNRGPMTGDDLSRVRDRTVWLITSAAADMQDWPPDMDGLFVGAGPRTAFGLYLLLLKLGVDVRYGGDDPVAYMLVEHGASSYDLEGKDFPTDTAECVRRAVRIRGMASPELRDMLLKSLRADHKRSAADIGRVIDFAVRTDAVLSEHGS